MSLLTVTEVATANPVAPANRPALNVMDFHMGISAPPTLCKPW
jgi:hypothetical protein